MEEKERKMILEDIADLKEKLVRVATAEVVVDVQAGVGTIELARQDHRIRLRNLKNLLKEKVSLWNIIECAEDILKKEC